MNVKKDTQGGIRSESASQDAYARGPMDTRYTSQDMATGMDDTEAGNTQPPNEEVKLRGGAECMWPWFCCALCTIYDGCCCC
jgi:hypothetical protein